MRSVDEPQLAVIDINERGDRRENAGLREADGDGGIGYTAVRGKQQTGRPCIVVPDGRGCDAGRDREEQVLVREGIAAHVDLGLAAPLRRLVHARQQTPGNDLELRHGLARIGIRCLRGEPHAAKLRHANLRIADGGRCGRA